MAFPTLLCHFARHVARALGLAALMGAGCAAAAAQTADAEAPSLQLNLESHLSAIRRIAVDAAATTVVTTSDDKTARLWDAQSGKLLHVLRPAAGPGALGRLYGAAMHPTEPLVAVGGTSAFGGDALLYLFDTVTGELRRQITIGSGEIKRIVWSRDGRFVAVGLANPGSLWVVSLDGALRFHAATTGDCYGIAINDRQQIAATDTAGRVQVYQVRDQSVTVVANVATPSKGPVAVAFAPSGQQFAVTYVYATEHSSGSARADIYAVDDGKALMSLSATDIGLGQAQSVGWSVDGTRIALGGFQQSTAGAAVSGFIQAFDAKSGARQQRWIVAKDTVTDLTPIGANGFAYASADATWGVIAADRISLQSGAAANYPNQAQGLSINATGSIVSWVTPMDPVGAQFDIAGRSRHPGVPQGVHPPRAPGFVSKTTDWENTLNPRINGLSFRLAAGEVSRAVHLLPETDDVIWATGQRLARIGHDGTVVWQLAPGAETRSVNSTDDARVIVAAFADGTIRWFRSSDGAHLLTLFTAADGKWLLWSPSGYYDASAGAEPLVGWLVNRKGDRASEFYTIGRFRERFYRPDVIDRVLVDRDERAAIEFSDRLRDVTARAPVLPPVVDARASGVAGAPTPAVEARNAASSAAAATQPAATTVANLLPPAINYRQAPTVTIPASAPVATLNFDVSVQPGQQITSIVVRRDGVLQPDAVTELPKLADGKGFVTVQVGVPQGESVVHIAAANENGYSDALAYTIRRDPVRAVPAAESSSGPGSGRVNGVPAKPRLFVLAVGVSKYAEPLYNTLQFAGKDATELAEMLARQRGRAFLDVSTRVLTDQAATKAAVLQGLEWLAASVGPNDYGILFLSGHGVNHTDGSYYFLPTDFNANRIADTAVGERHIRSTLVNLKGRSIFFVDTCHAGNAVGIMSSGARDISKIANELASPENGVIVFASSNGRQESYERLDWGNGAFTKELVAGLRGGADLLKRGQVTFQGLGYFVSEEVSKLTGGLQTPVLIVPPPGFSDFSLAEVRDGEKLGRSGPLGGRELRAYAAPWAAVPWNVPLEPRDAGLPVQSNSVVAYANGR
jgi:hypothetical protein